MTTTAHHPQHPAKAAPHACPFPETGCTATTCHGPSIPANLIRVTGEHLRIQGTVTIIPDHPNALAAAAAQIDRAWGLQDFPGPLRTRGGRFRRHSHA